MTPELTTLALAGRRRLAAAVPRRHAGEQRIAQIAASVVEAGPAGLDVRAVDARARRELGAAAPAHAGIDRAVAVEREAGPADVAGWWSPASIRAVAGDEVGAVEVNRRASHEDQWSQSAHATERAICTISCEWMTPTASAPRDARPDRWL